MHFAGKISNVFGLLSFCGGHSRELKGAGSLSHAVSLCQKLTRLPPESNGVSWDWKALPGPQCCKGEEPSSSCWLCVSSHLMGLPPALALAPLYSYCNITVDNNHIPSYAALLVKASVMMDSPFFEKCFVLDLICS